MKRVGVVLLALLWAHEAQAAECSGPCVASLPVPHANNAVASAVHSKDGLTFYSFNGLKPGKTYRDISKSAFACVPSVGSCRTLPDVPVAEGRLASIAATIENKIYLFGGYTVAEDHSEVSTPEVFLFDPETETYQRRADMPVPVDDSVALPYQDRYIYLVSGWHMDRNVSLVQVYDTREDKWFQATDYPGAPVFGHAGGIANGKFVIAHGVAVIAVENGRRRFGGSKEVWQGEIDADNPAHITWTVLPNYKDDSRYRMAAVGVPETDMVVFAGGADNPYNYDGIGYDKVPANPFRDVFAYDFAKRSWVMLGTADQGTMDHRGLLIAPDGFYTVGGMNEKQTVIGDVRRVLKRTPTQ